MSAKVMGMSRDGCGLDENHRAELGQCKTQTGLRVKLMSEVRRGCLSKLEPNKAKSQGGKGGQGGSVKVCYDPSDF